jgi:intein/homing endonuclease
MTESVHAIRQEGYQLLHEGAIELARVESNGIRIDVERLRRVQTKLAERIRDLKNDLLAEDIWKRWRRRFGDKASLGSRDQLSTLLHVEMGYEVVETTDSGAPSTDEEALSRIDLPFVPKLIRFLKYEKALGTYLKGIERELVGDRIHPFFNLHTVISFRSSSSDPNFQNQPTRDKEIAKIIRRNFIPSDGSVLVENDFKGIEVALSASYHHDPNFISYITTPGKDMHRDMAAQIYCLDPKDVSKEARYGAKNKFVFPQFYGDYYIACAKNLWDWIEKGKLTTPSGISLFDHLKSEGITWLGDCDPEVDPAPDSFEAHLQDIEDDFWNNRFKVYGQWRKDWHQAYLKKGYFDLLTGFRIHGSFNRKQCGNLPIQGCLVGSSRVLTKKGLIPIQELEGQLVEVWTGFRWAKAVGLNRGKAQRAKVILSSGLVIQCDTRHKFKNEVGKWIDFQDLKIGNKVALPKMETALSASEKMNWWFVFGFIIGDGCITNPRKYLQIVVGKTKKADLEKIHQFLLDEGFNDGGYRGVHLKVKKVKGRNDQYHLWIQSKHLAAFLEKAGFRFGMNAHTKRIPSSVWTASDQNRRDFLEGVWRSDGSRGKNTNHRLNLCNKPLLQELQVLAASVGFDSFMVEADTKKAWRVTFHAEKFNGKPPRRYPIEAVKNQMAEVSLENYEDGRNAWITDKRCFTKGEITQYVGERMLERNAPKNAEVYRYDSIVEISILSKKETTYTMSVNDALHQFVADGVIHKNSAFHCLLWSLIQVNRQLCKYKMRSLIVGQIHDSLVGDVRVEELRDYLEIVEQVTTVDLRKHYDWLVVPPEIEYEIATDNWFEKQEFKFKDGLFLHPEHPEKTTDNPHKFLATLAQLKAEKV